MFPSSADDVCFSKSVLCLYSQSLLPWEFQRQEESWSWEDGIKQRSEEVDLGLREDGYAVVTERKPRVVVKGLHLSLLINFANSDTFFARFVN